MFGQLLAEQQIALAFGLTRRRRDFLDDQISQRAD
jgi:recombinational DNA repair ATPase RecF